MASKAQTVRIIGGALRGRRLHFPKDSAVRPTPDRVRETVFNWLAPHLLGARVLDVFAGSGALGIESLSRGAAKVVLLDRDPRCVQAMADQLRAWRIDPSQYVIQRADSLAWLARPNATHIDADGQKPFDIVLLDPPFDLGLWPSVIRALEGEKWLAPQALLYIETPAAAESALGALDTARWELLRSRKAGEVGYHLYRYRQVDHSHHTQEAG